VIRGVWETGQIPPDWRKGHSIRGRGWRVLNPLANSNFSKGGSGGYMPS